MDIHARHIAVNGRHKQLLPPTSFRIAEGQLALVRCVQEEATALALALSGRIEPDDGAVLLDGEGDDAGLREQVALVDSPRVNEPEAALPLSAVIAEGLCLAGHPSGKTTVREWLEEHHADEYARYRFETLPAPLRTRLLVELAVIPPQVRVLILDTPDRHTGDAQTWWTTALRQAQRGLGVVVLCSDGAARSLPVDSARVGQMQQPAPITVSVDGVHIADVPAADPRLGTQYGDLRSGDDVFGGQITDGQFTDGQFTDGQGWAPEHRDWSGPPNTEAPADAEQTVQVPLVDDQLYGEHQYSDVDFAEQERLANRDREHQAWAPTRTELPKDLPSRLSGSLTSGDTEPDTAPDAQPDAQPDAVASDDGEAPDTKPDDTEPAAAPDNTKTVRTSTEETTTLQRVSDREDSQS